MGTGKERVANMKGGNGKNGEQGVKASREGGGK